MYSKKVTKEIQEIIKDKNLNCTIPEFIDAVNWEDISSYKTLMVSHQKNFFDHYYCWNIFPNKISFSNFKTLSEDFLDVFQNKLNWDSVSQHQNLSEPFIEKFYNKINWDLISEYQVLSGPFIIKFKDKLNWEKISRYQELSGTTIRKCSCKVWWETISAHQNLSEDFMREFQNVIAWRYIPMFQNLSEDFIREFQHILDWGHVSNRQFMSESFIREFQNSVDWFWISVSQKLSESFIIEFQNEVDWEGISFHQELSEDFIRRFKDKVYWEEICVSQNLSPEFLKEFSEEICIADYNRIHREKSYSQKLKEVRAYAKKYNLKVDDQYLYAFRQLDQFGRLDCSEITVCKKNIYYKNWHCGRDNRDGKTFGMRISPMGNTKIKVKIEDWGVKFRTVPTALPEYAMVLGFEMI